jgi:hypothetical protein
VDVEKLDALLTHPDFGTPDLRRAQSENPPSVSDPGTAMRNRERSVPKNDTLGQS